MNDAGNIIGSKDEKYLYNDDYNISKNSPELFNDIINNKEGFSDSYFMGDHMIITYDYYEPLSSYFLAYKSKTELSQILVEQVWSNAFTLIIIVLVSLFMLFFLIRRIINPISLLAEYAQQVKKGDFETRVDAKILKRKDEIGILGTTFSNMISTLKDNFTLLEKNAEEFEYYAEHDSLTKLWNRHYFEKHLKTLIANGEAGSVILVDIDDFKIINDTEGHVFGDEVLIRIANVLNNIIEGCYVVARFGGDEFIISVKETEASNNTKLILNKLFEAFSNPFLINNIAIDLSFSAGISIYPKDSKTFTKLIKFADMALYAVKDKGKNNYKYFENHMEIQSILKSKIQQEIKTAMDHDGFEMLFQAQVNLATGEVDIFEALIRLKNRAYGPAEFIPVAEETGSIIWIGRWVVVEVIKKLDKWRFDGGNIKPISINYSAVQLQDRDFISFLGETLINYDVDPKFIELEVTETIFIHEYSYAKTFFEEIKALGINLSIDDFGKGYSSLSYLINLPIHKIKLDSSLINKLIENSNYKALENIIGLSHSLDLVVVAEGVETKESTEKLMAINCNYIQGHYFSKPIDSKRIIDELSK